MASSGSAKQQTISTKLPAELVAGIDRMAHYRGVSRSGLLRELIETALDGKVILGPPSGLRGLTVRELGASDVGRAARKKAQLDVEAACRDARGARRGGRAAGRGVDPTDAEEIAGLMAARVAQGLRPT